MKDYIKAAIVCLLLGCLACFGLCYASGAFMSDEDYAKAHPEIMASDNWESYFNDPNSVKQYR